MLSKLPMLMSIRNYQKAHREALGEYSHLGTLPPQPTKEQWKMLDKTFHQFLIDCDAEPLIPLLLLGHTAQVRTGLGVG